MSALTACLHCMGTNLLFVHASELLPGWLQHIKPAPTHQVEKSRLVHQCFTLPCPACAATTLPASGMPFTPDPENSSCQLYTTKEGDTLARLSTLGRIGVRSILLDNLELGLRPEPMKAGLKVRMCNMDGVPSSEAAGAAHPADVAQCA
jgi:hypothetical protein